MAELEVVPEDWTRALAVVAHPDDIERGVASLREHRAYLDAIAPEDADPEADPAAFVRDWALAAGPRLGVDAAATFELIPLS